VRRSAAGRERDTDPGHQNHERERESREFACVAVEVSHRRTPNRVDNVGNVIPMWSWSASVIRRRRRRRRRRDDSRDDRLAERGPELGDGVHVEELQQPPVDGTDRGEDQITPASVSSPSQIELIASTPERTARRSHRRRTKRPHRSELWKKLPTVREDDERDGENESPRGGEHVPAL